MCTKHYFIFLHYTLIRNDVHKLNNIYQLRNKYIDILEIILVVVSMM